MMLMLEVWQVAGPGSPGKEVANLRDTGAAAHV